MRSITLILAAALTLGPAAPTLALPGSLSGGHTLPPDPCLRTHSALAHARCEALNKPKPKAATKKPANCKWGAPCFTTGTEQGGAQHQWGNGQGH